MKNKNKITDKDIVYIAGPMTGIEEYNYPAFFHAQEILEDVYGCAVLNPATAPGRNLNYRDYMRLAVNQVCHATAIFMLKGWENSKGACAEYALAEALDLKIIFEVEAYTRDEAIGELAKRTFELEQLKSDDWWMECVDCCHCGYMPDITIDGSSFWFICNNTNCFRQSAKTNDISDAITAWNQKIRDEER